MVGGGCQASWRSYWVGDGDEAESLFSPGQETTPRTMWGGGRRRHTPSLQTIEVHSPVRIHRPL